MQTGVRNLDKKLTVTDLEKAGMKAIELGFSKAFNAFYSLWTFFETMADTRKFDGGRDLIIYCPDDGKNVAIRVHGRWVCPKCCGHSWHIAGLGHESFRMKFSKFVDSQQDNVVEFPDGKTAERS